MYHRQVLRRRRALHRAGHECVSSIAPGARRVHFGWVVAILMRRGAVVFSCAPAVGPKSLFAAIVTGDSAIALRAAPGRRATNRSARLAGDTQGAAPAASPARNGTAVIERDVKT